MTRTLPRLTRLLILLALPGCSGDGAPPEPRVSGAWARPRSVAPGVSEPEAGANTAVYLEIRNPGRVPDRLLGCETPAAATVEIHQTVMDGDIARMRKVDGVDLPPGETVRMEPGGMHLMMLDIRGSLSPGAAFSLTLFFQNSPPVTLAVPVSDTDPR